MVDYNDHTKILSSLNFIGGAGQSTLPNTGNDERAILEQVNGAYQVDYFVLASLQDMYDLDYYDTPDDDFNNDGIYDSEYLQLPTGQDPSLNAHQLIAISNIVNSTAYSVSFQDVANVNFNLGSVSNANIVIGSNVSGGDMLPTFAAYSKGYDNAKESIQKRTIG